MFLLVGLGNPGKKYEFNRHNIGFLAVDCFMSAFPCSEKEEHKALTYRLKVDGEDVIVAKPQTYMNLSGESVQSLLNYYKVPLENLLVIQDDADQTYGSIKFQKNRGHGGQNGIRNIHQMLGTSDYTRLKLGVGRPIHPQQDVADYVLQNFSKEDSEHLEEFLKEAAEAMESFILDGIDKATSRFNRKVNYREKDI